MSLAFQHKPESFSAGFSVRLDDAYVKTLLQIGKTLDGEICQLKAAARQLLTGLHKFYNQRLSVFSSAVGSGSSTS